LASELLPVQQLSILTAIHLAAMCSTNIQLLHV